ncbi:MAG: EAL domain-containing protein [Asticcacaulis sp.]
MPNESLETLTPLDILSAGSSIQKAAEAMRRHLGMAVAYVSEFVGDLSVFRAVDAPGLESVIKPGDAKSLDDVFCRHILAGRLPELMPDVSAIPFAMTCPIMQEVPIGSHMSVPIRLQSGEIYGMFCCLSFEKNLSLNERDLNMMRVFADMAAHQIEDDLQHRRQSQNLKHQIEVLMTERKFQNVFQPICDIATGKPLGYETLCRFQTDPYRSPDQWFKDADSVGLGLALEQAVLAEAMRVSKDLPQDVYLSINASPELLTSNWLLDEISRFQGRSILVEVTEHVAVSDYGLIQASIARLRAIGAKIAVDDAGAGYSGLQHILQLQPDIIKLDNSLVRNIDTDAASRSLLAALIFFARETDCGIVAEGIETDAQRVILQSLGVTKGQGYFLGRPMSLDAAQQFTKALVA